MSKPKPQLTWDAVYDDDDNVGYDATCRVYGPDDTFEYRVRQFLISNRIQWTLMKSDDEVVSVEDRWDRWFTNATAAKRHCEKLEREHRREAKKEIALCSECEKEVHRDTTCDDCGNCEDCCECGDKLAIAKAKAKAK